MLKNDICKLRVLDGWTASIDNELRNLMSLQKPASGKYFTKGNYDGWCKKDMYNRLRLICPQLDKV